MAKFERGGVARHAYFHDYDRRIAYTDPKRGLIGFEDGSTMRMADATTQAEIDARNNASDTEDVQPSWIMRMLGKK